MRDFRIPTEMYDSMSDSEYLIFSKILRLADDKGIAEVSYRDLERKIPLLSFATIQRCIRVCANNGWVIHSVIHNRSYLTICDLDKYKPLSKHPDTPCDTLVSVSRERSKEKTVLDNNKLLSRTYSQEKNINNNAHTHEGIEQTKKRLDCSPVEYNKYILDSINSLPENASLTPYQQYVVWVYSECRGLLDFLKLPSESNFEKTLGYFGLDTLKETTRNMNNRIDYCRKKKYCDFGQTLFNWAKKEHGLVKKMTVQNPNDENEVKFVKWVNESYPSINTLKIPFTYKDYCYLISKFDKGEVTRLIILWSAKGFEGIENLRDMVEYMILKK